jgi:isopentenyl phosphate kinase
MRREVWVALAALSGAAAFVLGRPGRRKPGIALVVKLGGAAVTHKQTLETANHHNIEASSEALALAAAESGAGGGRGAGAGGICVVHGAGSFGHFQAREYGISKGVSAASFSWLGFALTRQSVSKLNQIVLGSLLRHELPAVSIPPFAAGWRKGEHSSAGAALRCVRAALEAGMIPVLHGDAVFTWPDSPDCRIISGDDLLVALCAELRPARAVFLTDVPGVFDRPPSQPGAILLRQIVVSKSGELQGLDAFESSAAVHDVTGGIRAKVAAAAAIASRGVPVIVCEAGTPHAARALRGMQPDVCTLFVPAPGRAGWAGHWAGIGGIWLGGGGGVDSRRGGGMARPAEWAGGAPEARRREGARWLVGLRLRLRRLLAAG